MAPGLAGVPFWEGFGLGPVILDGGLATELERRGADLRDPLWSAKLLLEDPVLIRQVHEAYVAAGADVATTATYQLSFEGFAQRGLDREQTVEAVRLSVRLAREAGPKCVAASVGPYGAFLADGSEFRGDYGLSVRQLLDWHRPRLQALADSGADLLACETLPCQAEAEALVRLLEDFPCTSAWFSFSCRDERLVSHGETLAACAAVVNHCPNAVAFGVNCTAPQFVEGLLQSVAGVTRKPLLAYPNLGGVWDGMEHVWRGGEEWDWAAAGSRWLAAGARLIGGCCRKVKNVYAHFGLAAYFGQVFETSLCNLLLNDARVRGEVTTPAEIDALELAAQKKTMGALTRHIRSKIDSPADAEAVIDTALDRRNFLNHRFFREHAEDFMSEAGRRQMLAELEEIQGAIQRADQMITLLCMALLKFLGVMPEMLHAEFERLKKKAQGRS